MKKWVLYGVIILAFIVQMMVVLPSGSHYCNNNICGIFFWGAHEHDGIWHLALINTGLKNWPVVFPTFAGQLLTGYNVLLDLFIKIFHEISSISVLTIYFKLIPIAWFASMVYVWAKFAKSYSKNTWYLPSILFFIFFGNSFSYLFRLYHEGIIWGASGLLSMQSPQMLNNIQYALTLPIIGLMVLEIKNRETTLKSSLLLGFFNFLLMGLKFYGGVVGIVMSIAYGLTFALDKKHKTMTSIIFISLFGFALSTLLFYDPLHSLSGQAILSYKPLATVHPIIEEAGLFFAPSIANLRNNLYGAGFNIRLLLIELSTIMLFVFFNWGSRIFGVFSVKPNRFNFVVGTGILAGFIMNILFVQRGEWWNTVQFLYYATFLSNIYAAEFLSKLLSGRFLARIAAVLLILVTIPNAIDTYRIFASYPPMSYVSDNEMVILNKLKELEQGVVLTTLINPVVGHEDQKPRPLYNMYDTAYVSAFSGKQTYLNDLVQMRLTGIDYSQRLKDVTTYNCNVLNDVKYVYVAQNQAPMEYWKECQDFRITELVSNDEAMIYLVTTDTPNQ